MKKPIDIYKRYKKPKRWFDIQGILTTVLTGAVGASQWALLASAQCPIEEKKARAFTTVLNTADAIVKIQNGSMQRRFKATGRYEK
jgi:hypothetical protein